MHSISNDTYFNKNEIDIVYYNDTNIHDFSYLYVVKLYIEKNTNICNIKKPIFLTYHMNTCIPTNKNIIICNIMIDDILLDGNNNIMVLNSHKNQLKLDYQNSQFVTVKTGFFSVWEYFFPDTLVPDFLLFINNFGTKSIDSKLNKNEYFILCFCEKMLSFDDWDKCRDINFDDWDFNLRQENYLKIINTGKKFHKFKKNISSQMMQNIYFCIHEINLKYYIVAYCNDSLPYYNLICENIMNVYNFVDFICVWNYDGASKKTIFNLITIDDKYDVSSIAKKYNGYGDKTFSCFVLTENRYNLPYEIIKDYDLINIMKYSQIKQIDMNQEKINYLLIIIEKSCVKNLCQEKYIDIIKRKNSNADFIIFQSISLESLESSENTIYDFIMVYNEYSAKTSDILSHNIMSTTNKIIEYSDSRNFDQQFPHAKIIQQNIKKKEYNDIHNLLNKFTNTE